MNIRYTWTVYAAGVLLGTTVATVEELLYNLRGWKFTVVGDREIHVHGPIPESDKP